MVMWKLITSSWDRESTSVPKITTGLKLSSASCQRELMAFTTVLSTIFLNASFATVLIKLVLALYRALCTSFHTRSETFYTEAELC